MRADRPGWPGVCRSGPAGGACRRVSSPQTQAGVAGSISAEARAAATLAALVACPLASGCGCRRDPRGRESSPWGDGDGDGVRRRLEKAQGGEGWAAHTAGALPRRPSLGHSGNERS